jgi:hypothetical protein
MSPAENTNGKEMEVSLLYYIEHIQSDMKEGFAASREAVKDALAAADKAVAAALASQQKSTSDAFTASEKAIVKAEHAQSLFNQASIDINSKLDVQAKQFITRMESLSTTKALEEKAETLRVLFDSKLEGMRQSNIKDVADAENGLVQVRTSLVEFITRTEHESTIGRLGQLETVQAGNISRAEVQKQFDDIDKVLEIRADRFAKIEASISKLEGRLLAGGTGVAVFSIIVAIALHFLK